MEGHCFYKEWFSLSSFSGKISLFICPSNRIFFFLTWRKKLGLLNKMGRDYCWIKRYTSNFLSMWYQLNTGTNGFCLDSPYSPITQYFSYGKKWTLNVTKMKGLQIFGWCSSILCDLWIIACCFAGMILTQQWLLEKVNVLKTSSFQDCFSDCRLVVFHSLKMSSFSGLIDIIDFLIAGHNMSELGELHVMKKPKLKDA